VPLTSGFLAKFYVIGAAVEADSYALALIAMLSAVVAAFVYLRITVAMYMSDESEGGEAADDADAAGAVSPAPAPAPVPVPVPPAAALALAVAVAFTLVVGILPSPVVDFARDAVPVLLTTGP
jgi:NADH-quinone oxidoreductase subunit N